MALLGDVTPVVVRKMVSNWAFAGRVVPVYSKLVSRYLTFAIHIRAFLHIPCRPDLCFVSRDPQCSRDRYIAAVAWKDAYKWRCPGAQSEDPSSPRSLSAVKSRVPVAWHHERHTVAPVLLSLSLTQSLSCVHDHNRFMHRTKSMP